MSSDSVPIPAGTTPVISPEGHAGFAPVENLDAALQHGFSRAVAMTSPEGKLALVPHANAAAALQQGFKSGQPEVQDSALSKNTSWLQRKLGGVASFGREAALGAGSSAGIPESNTPVSDTVKSLTDTSNPVVNVLDKIGIPAPASNLVKNIATAHYNEGKQAVQDFRNKDYTHGIVRAAGTLAPVVGPGIAEGGIEAEKGIKAGDPDAIAHGLGKFAGSVAGGALGTERGSEVAGTAIEKASNAVKLPVKAVADKGAQALQTAKDVIRPEQASPEKAATMAFRPRNSKYNWQQEISSALPDMKRAAETRGVDVNNVTLQDAQNLANHAKHDVWDEYQNNHLGPNQTANVDTSPVADSIRRTVSNRTREQDPGFADKIESIASTYDQRQLPLKEIESRVQELNGQTRAIEARHPADKQAAQSDPANAPIFAERNGLRNLLTSKLDEISGPGAQELRNRYGSLKSVEDVIQRRIPVAERQAPEGLSSILAKAYGFGKVAKGVLTMNPADIAEGGISILSQRRAAKLNDPDYLTQQALKNTKSRPAPVQQVDGEYLTEPEPKQLKGGQGSLPSGQYEAPASSQPPQKELGSGVIDGEYMPPENPRVRVRGILPKGQYNQPASTAPPNAARALPPITLAARIARMNNAVEAVGMPETAEGAALQKHSDAKPQPSPMPTFLRGKTASFPTSEAVESQPMKPNFKTGQPVEFPYIRNTEKAPHMGSLYGQDKEPTGRYLSLAYEGGKPPDARWETGTAKFNNPLVVDWGEGYQSEGNWKNVLSRKYGGKTGAALSDAIRKAGHDGIVTIDKYGPSEIVDLTKPSNLSRKKGAR